MRVGNPQCVLLVPELDEARLHRIGAGAPASIPRFPQAVNVELAHVESPDAVRILIWERGVGPTASSGTGSCAAGVAAAAYGGARATSKWSRPEVAQRVEWVPTGAVLLTGWAEVVLRGDWLSG